MSQEAFYPAVSHPSRRKLLKLLQEEPNMTASAISEHLGINKPTLSAHLRTLREAGLVVPTRAGVRIHYRVDKGALMEGVNGVLDLAGLGGLPSVRNGRTPGEDADPETRRDLRGTAV
nr:winged helix-turn-helix domain-containing protein [Nocardiopsis sp. FIRDI 009]